MIATFDSSTFYPSVILGQNTPEVCQTEPQDVSEQADTAIPGSMTDDEREAAIVRAGDLMERRYKQFERTGDLADLGDAHKAMLHMKTLASGRREGRTA